MQINSHGMPLTPKQKCFQLLVKLTCVSTGPGIRSNIALVRTPNIFLEWSAFPGISFTAFLYLRVATYIDEKEGEKNYKKQKVKGEF